MNKQLAITSSPHFRSPTTTQDIMRDVIIALAPTLFAAAYLFGLRALLVCGVCMAACVLFEYLYRRLMGLKQTAGDLSAAVTGLLLAFGLPVSIPIWVALIGCFVSIVIVKQLFGGIGKNFANPAIVGRIVLFISFATYMSTWALPTFLQTPDAVTGATPLVLAAGGADAVTSATLTAAPPPAYWELFLGLTGGSLGETCKLTLLAGGLYLVWRRVITLTAPLSFIGSVFVLSWAFGADPVYQVLAGSVILGAFFMATDYVTTPTTEWGKLLFGVGCGVITVVIRQMASYPEGVSFGILLMNIATPHIDRLTSIRAFGSAKTAKKAG